MQHIVHAHDGNVTSGELLVKCRPSFDIFSLVSKISKSQSHKTKFKQ